MNERKREEVYSCHNPYFNRWFSAIEIAGVGLSTEYHVTILILIDGFLQYTDKIPFTEAFKRHNPYFNRWFSAMRLDMHTPNRNIRHNPYFNRWFSAIHYTIIKSGVKVGHNPYFNRWFSAIRKTSSLQHGSNKSQSLF